MLLQPQPRYVLPLRTGRYAKQLTEAGLWYATAPEEDLIELMRQEPGLLRDWDEKYGDRMQKIVFIGQHMDKEQIIRDLDKCLE